jgi:hypothetical protein
MNTIPPPKSVHDRLVGVWVEGLEPVSLVPGVEGGLGSLRWYRRIDGVTSFCSGRRWRGRSHLVKEVRVAPDPFDAFRPVIGR